MPDSFDPGGSPAALRPGASTSHAEPAGPAPNDFDALDRDKFRDEDACIAAFLAAPPLDSEQRAAVTAEAVTLVEGARRRGGGMIDGFLHEYALDTAEGLALMSLAEALLRTPDTATRDRLIAERIASGDWYSHHGASPNSVVNAGTLGLVLTDRVLKGALDPQPRSVVERLIARAGEPLVRRAVAAAVAMMGGQFVLAPTIEAALGRARREGLTCSFDMLGEAARMRADADRFESLYTHAIAAVSAAERRPPARGHSLSVKLSALCPRFEAVKPAELDDHLYPRLKRLAETAAAAKLGFSVDAEEADRLVPTITLFARLLEEPSLAGWNGLGIVVQAYQKRAGAVIDMLAALARRHGRRIPVRLVKGAYWDGEIKRAQIAGHPDYPVYTTKPATDVAYLDAARRLIGAGDTLFPQFATHNAHTLAAVRHMAEHAGAAIEHQRLHGMGDALYHEAKDRYGDAMAVRTYAPVGGHDELLPYLVRRLLENGANTGFVNALLDREVPVAEVVQDPLAQLTAAPHRHPRIPPPPAIFGPSRRNASGYDLTQAETRARIARAVADGDRASLSAGPMVAGRAGAAWGNEEPVLAPHDGHRIGTVRPAGKADLDAAIAAAHAAQPEWDRRGGSARARVLRAMGDALEQHGDALLALLAREAGKTLPDGIAEVREAVDFCRYYASLAEAQFEGPITLPGPVGEANTLALRGRGVFACISPWNFPLAIFTGQIAAALAAGNAVIAKPAEQTPLIAAEAVRQFRAAGLPEAVLALLPGDGAQIGAALVAHPGIAGVAFTGGTDTARAINRTLAERDGPIVRLIAETGGLNGMFADSTALTEQLVDDCIASAFGSAGQRCSALRMLYLPEEIADRVIGVLKGAMDCLTIGDPADPATDTGPVIDGEAQAMLKAHIARLEREAIVHRRVTAPAKGHFVGPVLAEVPTADFLEREVFGPVLHVYRYRPGEVERAARALAARGYALTLGVHSRIDGFARTIAEAVPAGNVYVNRSMIGAVVGVQPFGGEGLSGTGPKAGGPHALLGYAVERARSVNTAAIGGDPRLLAL